MRFVVFKANAGDVEGLVALDEPEAAVGLADGKVAKNAQSSCRGAIAILQRSTAQVTFFI